MTRASSLITDAQRSVNTGSRDQRSSERTYTCYGHSPSGPGPLPAFASERHDQVTACYHLGNGYRLYSPSLMRFLNPDRLSPFGRGGINKYAYCAGDPINRIDPSGRFWEVLTSIEVTRATTVAAYTGLNIAALTSRIHNRSGLWGNWQLLVESTLVLTGTTLLFTGSERLQPVALGMMSVGNVTSIAKSAVTIASNLTGGFRGAADAAWQNMRLMTGYAQLGEQVQVSPSQQASGSVVINIKPGVVNINMDSSSSPSPAAALKKVRRNSTGSIEATRL